MLLKDECFRNAYAEQMNAIKQINFEKQKALSSNKVKSGVRLYDFKNASIKNKIKILINRIKNRKQEEVWEYYKKDLDTAFNNRDNSNYFLDDRIAVYTCIIGKYDMLQEPLVCPDNIDYYAITDFDIPMDSKWKRIDANEFEEIKDFSAPLKNRYFKINPHLVFKNYRYSVYVDGNFRICTDFTEHVNRMSKLGFSHFLHSKRTCAYQEANVCKLLGKETELNILNYTKRLKENGFPENYGLLACDILVREHNKESCIKIMEQWWYEFKNYVKRDQLSLPFVLYKNEIRVDEVSTLGGDVHKDYSFEIVKHN